MEFLHKGTIRGYLSIIAIILMCVVRPVAGMQQTTGGDITDLYIIPVASKGTGTKTPVKDRPWQVLVTQDKQGCCGMPQWRFLHIPVKKLFYFNVIRGWFGDFTLNQREADKNAYKALALLTHGRMSKATALYHSLRQGLDAKSLQKLKEKNLVTSLFSKQDGKAKYFFIPVEYTDSVVSRHMDWMDPDTIVQAAAIKEETEIQKKTAVAMKAYWKDAIVSIINTIQDLEGVNTAYRLARLIGTKSPKQRWNELQNTLEIISSSQKLLDPRNGAFKIDDKRYSSPEAYYLREGACEKSESEDQLYECGERDLFVGNLYKFKQGDIQLRKKLLDTGNQVLIYSDPADALIGTGSNYRGLNNQGRILMFLRGKIDELDKMTLDKNSIENAYKNYRSSDCPCSIPNLFASHNLRSKFMRAIIKLRARL